MKDHPLHERTVIFGYYDEDKAGAALASQVNRDLNEGQMSLGAIAGSVPKFIRETGFTTFTAEHALHDGDIVIHFYHPQGFETVDDYWERTFPTLLDTTAREYFAADRPRLQAKYTPEFNSWWFRARSYGHLTDVRKYVEKFFEVLDRALDAAG